MEDVKRVSGGRRGDSRCRALPCSVLSGVGHCVRLQQLKSVETVGLGSCYGKLCSLS